MLEPIIMCAMFEVFNWYHFWKKIILWVHGVPMSEWPITMHAAVHMGLTERSSCIIEPRMYCARPPQVKTILDEFLEKLAEEFNMLELFARAEEKTPYVLVALQECERMNSLTNEMKRSLKEVDLGLKVCSEETTICYSGVHVVCFSILKG